MSPNEKFQRAVEALLYIASRTHENIPGFEDARKMSTMEAWWHAYMVIRTHAQNTLREIEILPYSCAEAQNWEIIKPCPYPPKWKDEIACIKCGFMVTRPVEGRASSACQACGASYEREAFL